MFRKIMLVIGVLAVFALVSQSGMAKEGEGRIVIHAKRSIGKMMVLEAYCDTGNGAMIYLYRDIHDVESPSSAPVSANDSAMSVVPNGCSKAEVGDIEKKKVN